MLYTKPTAYCGIKTLPEPYCQINIMETASYLYNFHEHDFFHINHVTSGRVTVTVGTQSREVIAGQTFVLPPDIPHRLESELGYRQIGIDLYECDDDRGLSKQLASIVGRKFVAVNAPGGEADYERMRRLLRAPSELCIGRAVNIADSMLYDLFEALLGREDEFAKAFNALSNGEPWRLSLAEICEKLGISRAQLERKANLSFGCGASEYAARLRFSELCRILRTTDLTLEQIAQQCAFNDASHLSVFFKGRSGTTPGQYRKG